jgi:anti-sigma regulatory factor (Ser/Thr protein kinase)
VSDLAPLARGIEVPASLESLRPLGEWLRQAAREAGIPKETAASLDLALHEAAENVVRYAWEAAGPHRIAVRFWADAERAEVELEDDGRPFDPLAVPPPMPPTSLDQAVGGGRGILLMRRFTHELRYRRDGARNRLTLVRRFREPL